MSVELFITNLDFLTKLQAVFNLDYFILDFNATALINVQGGIVFKINKRACTSIRYTRVCRLFVPKLPNALPKSSLYCRFSSASIVYNGVKAFKMSH
jgi:hypothetical protein